MAALPSAPPLSGHLVIGIDTHKHLHVAAALDTIAGPQDSLTFTNDSDGYAQLTQWAADLGQVIAFGIEGTGSYGQTLTRYLHQQGCRVIEVNRPDRAARARKGKSDAVDAENAARAVLSGLATATPKSADGAAEAIRRLKVAYNTGVKCRSQTMNALKNLLVHADEPLRNACAGLSAPKLARKLSRLRPGPTGGPDQAARVGLRSLARRWIVLDEEVHDLTAQIEALVQSHAPELLEVFGIGPDVAAEILIVVGDNPDRINSEAALAKIAGACPIPAGSGKTDGRHRLNRGGNRTLNSALYHVVLCRMRFHQPTKAYLARRMAEGKNKREIIRCLKRYVVREVYRVLKPDPTPT
ncbi:IS110 family RNA-guided transposase [Salininema proteolyticum]|uniref:IS110 family transposase n=1 Tax=Salininema proteolyticum TaxID=1607685 RepID=A0ABV8TSC5_9ACTN